MVRTGRPVGGRHTPNGAVFCTLKLSCKLLTPTTVASVKRSSASVCVCPLHNSKTNDPKVLKLGTPWDIIEVIESSKVKATGSQSAKHIEGDRVAGVSLHSIE